MIDAGTTMGAVTLKVADLQQAARFYQEVIGLRLLHETGETATLGTPERSLVHLRHLPNGRFTSPATGLYHMALRVPTRQALASWLKHYGEAGGPNWQGAADHGVSNALYLSDPEGNGIEIYWDLPREEWPRTRDGGVEMYTRALDLQALVQEAEQNGWAGMAAETDMGHVHLKVASIPAARSFYVDTMGFELIVDWAGSALFVAAGGYHHHLGLNTWESRQAPALTADAYGLERFEIRFATQEALGATVEQLKEHGKPVETAENGFVTRDPCNTGIVLRLNPARHT